MRFLGHEGNRAEVTAAGFGFTAYERALAFSCREVNPPERMVEITYNFPGQTEAMQNILDGVGGLPARVLVTTGPVIDAADLRAGANTELLDYVDHDLLMPRASLVIGHGGHATSMRALAHDLPLLVMPMHPMLDQPLVGRAVQDAGAGLMLPKEAAPDQIRAAAEELLADGPHRAAAARLGKLIREGNGAGTAADRIETLVRSGVPRG